MLKINHLDQREQLRLLLAIESLKSNQHFQELLGFLQANDAKLVKDLRNSVADIQVYQGKAQYSGGLIELIDESRTLLEKVKKNLVT